MSKRINRFLSICIVVMVTVTSCFLFQIIYPQKALAAQITVSEVVQTSDGKGYLEVDGKPFFYFGIQNCGKQQTLGEYGTQFPTPLPEDLLENCFEKSSAAGFKTIQIILKWSEIEPEEYGEFDWTLVNKYVDWANEYDLYIDWVWFGANSCGGASLYSIDGWVHSIPLYLDDHDKYFGNGDASALHHSPWVPDGGAHDADAQYLWGCERNAVTNLFNHLAAYDTNHRSILFQVMNEPNFHPTWSAQNSIHLDLLDKLGKAVKDSDYVVATRVNLHPYVPNASVNDLQYIDFVGSDPYNQNVSYIANEINKTDYSDLVYIAENAGDYENNSSLVVTALVNGGFYDVWQLNDHWCPFGIYDGDIVNYKDWTLGTIPALRHSGTDLKNLNGALNSAGSIITTASKENMAGYNIDGNYPAQFYTASKALGDFELGYSCTDASVGMAVVDNDTIYCLSDTAGQTPVNIALGKTASMNTGVGFGFVPGRAIDGNLNTYAQSSSDVPWDLTIDLGSSYSVNKVVFSPNAYNYATEYTIDLSTDNTNWTTVASEANGTGRQKAYTFNSTQARYVKINVAAEYGGGSNWGHAIEEVKVYSPDVLSSPSVFTVNAVPADVAVGHFDSNDAWVTDEARSYTDNGNGTYSFNIGPEEFIRIRTNMALGKTASMNAGAGWGHVAGYAIDGIWSTYAQSDSDVPWDLTVDLGSVSTVSKIRFEPDPGNYATQFTIDISNDNNTWTTVATETSGGGYAEEYEFAPASARYVKINVTNEYGGGANWGHAIHDVKIYGITSDPSPVNLSIGKSASMNTSVGWGHVADYAIDGNWNTFAQSASDVPWDLTVDLGNNHLIGKVTFEADPSNYATKFTIDVSPDNSTWFTVASEEAGVGYPRTYTFETFYARYLRINVTEEAGSCHAIHEVKIYEK